MKVKKRILLIIALCILIVFATSTVAYADADQPWTDKGYGSVNGDLNRTLVSWAWDIFGPGLALTAAEMLKIDSTQEIGPGITMNHIYGDILDSIAGIGLALMCLYAAIDTIEKIENENFTIDHMIKLFIKLMVGFLILSNLKPIIDGGLALSNALMDTIANSIPDSVSSLFNKWYDRCKDGNFFKQIGNLVALLIPWVFSYISIIVVYFICFARFIEFFVRAALAPIGMANIIGKGLDAPGWRYFKKLLAVGLQGSVIVTILYISAVVKGNIDSLNPLNALSEFVGVIVVSIVTVALVLKSQSWANDLVGV